MSNSVHEDRVRRLAKRVDCRVEKSRSKWKSDRPYSVVRNHSNMCITLDDTIDGAEYSIRREAERLGIDLLPARQNKEKSIMDQPLFPGSMKTLGEATSQDLREAAAYYEKQAREHTMKAGLLRKRGMFNKSLAA